MAEPAPPSRQALVVPPRTSNIPVVLGAFLCGCIGFGVVWALGLGRTRSERPVASEQEFVPDGHPTDHATIDHATEFPVRAASFEPLEPVMQAGGDQRARPFSRFSQPAAADIDIPATEPAESAFEPEDRALTAGGSGEDASPPATPDDSADPPVEVPRPLDVPLIDAVPLDPGDAHSNDLDPGATVVLPPAAHPLDADPPTAGDSEIDTDPAAAVTLPDLPALEARPPDPPATAVTPPPQDDDSASIPIPTAPEVPQPAPAPSPFAQAPPVRDPEAFPSPPPSPPTSGGLLPRFAPAPVPMPAGSSPPPVPPPVALAAAVPFAAAPPLAGGPAAAASGGSLPPADSLFADPGFDAEGPSNRRGPDPQESAGFGQGRPGPAQLEGVQSPQLTVEKRGPREVQVGKPARYEILVRNVGSATAQDVFLRDAVPYGTSLVTTTPPAAPGQSGADAELVWPLGELPPGGQARVVIELMPQIEGDIGSVASVSFRAEASVRSRATKPALAITCTAPEPTRIGRDAGLSITVSNPGTGVATGVVLEGFLPENVSHRSGSELEFDVGQLKPGENRTIDLVLGTRGPGIHTARFAARADGGLEAEEFARLEVTAPTLELAIDMPLRRFLQRTATCEISMVNAGTATARSIELAAQLPPGMKFVRANNAGWHDDRTHRVLWNLEELPAGETGAVEVVVMPVDLGPQKIVAAARSADGVADQTTHVCEVEGLAALSFEVTDSEDPIEVDGLTEYVIRVGNQGTKPATGVRLVATLLGDLEPVDARGPAGHRVENLAVLFEPLASLAPAEEAVYRVRARGRSAGDQRVQIQLMSADQPAPITKEEVTRVYSDR